MVLTTMCVGETREGPHRLISELPCRCYAVGIMAQSAEALAPRGAPGICRFPALPHGRIDRSPVEQLGHGMRADSSQNAGGRRRPTGLFSFDGQRWFEAEDPFAPDDGESSGDQGPGEPDEGARMDAPRGGDGPPGPRATWACRWGGGSTLLLQILRTPMGTGTVQSRVTLDERQLEWLLSPAGRATLARYAAGAEEPGRSPPVRSVPPGQVVTEVVPPPVRPMAPMVKAPPLELDLALVGIAEMVPDESGFMTMQNARLLVAPPSKAAGTVGAAQTPPPAAAAPSATGPLTRTTAAQGMVAAASTGLYAGVVSGPPVAAAELAAVARGKGPSAAALTASVALAPGAGPPQPAPKRQTSRLPPAPAGPGTSTVAAEVRVFVRDLLTEASVPAAFVVWVGQSSLLEDFRELIAAELHQPVSEVMLHFRLRALSDDSASLLSLGIADGCTVTATRRDWGNRRWGKGHGESSGRQGKGVGGGDPDDDASSGDAEMAVDAVLEQVQEDTMEGEAGAGGSAGGRG